MKIHEELALIYMQQEKLKELSPEDFADKFLEVGSKIESAITKGLPPNYSF